MTPTIMTFWDRPKHGDSTRTSDVQGIEGKGGEYTKYRGLGDSKTMGHDTITAHTSKPVEYVRAALNLYENQTLAVMACQGGSLL